MLQNITFSQAQLVSPWIGHMDPANFLCDSGDTVTNQPSNAPVREQEEPKPDSSSSSYGAKYIYPSPHAPTEKGIYRCPSYLRCIMGDSVSNVDVQYFHEDIQTTVRPPKPVPSLIRFRSEPILFQDTEHENVQTSLATCKTVRPGSFLQNRVTLTYSLPELHIDEKKGVCFNPLLNETQEIHSFNTNNSAAFTLGSNFSEEDSCNCADGLKVFMKAIYKKVKAIFRIIKKKK